MKSTILLLFLSLVFLSLSTCLYGQKFVQMEKYGTLKVKRYYVGETLTFRLEGDKYWYTDVIRDILPEDDLIVFENRAVKVKDITFLKSFHNAAWSKGIAMKLYIFAGGWLVFNFGGLPLGGTLSALTWQVPALAVATGFIIRTLFRSKKYKIGKRRWLRLLDLSVTKPLITP